MEVDQEDLLATPVTREVATFKNLQGFKKGLCDLKKFQRACKGRTNFKGLTLRTKKSKGFMRALKWLQGSLDSAGLWRSEWFCRVLKVFLRL